MANKNIIIGILALAVVAFGGWHLFFRLPDLTLATEEIVLDKPISKTVGFAFIPETNRFLLLGKSGRILLYELDEFEAKRKAEVRIKNFTTQSGCGAFSLLLDPDFAENNFFYVLHCSSDSRTVLSRFTYKDSFATTTDTETVVYSVPNTDSGVTYASGPAVFGKDQSLYLFFGDRNVVDAKENLSTPFGKIFRLLPVDENRNEFTGHPGNPHDDYPWVLTTGLKLPTSAIADSEGNVWVADNRSDSQGEYVYKITPETTTLPAAQLLWEADTDIALLRKIKQSDSRRIRMPYVGLFYEPAGPDPYEGLLKDKLLVGDICLNWLAAESTDAEQEIVSEAGVVGRLLFTASSFAQGSDGYIYIATHSTKMQPTCFPSDLRETMESEDWYGKVFRLTLNQ